jgi:O-methyltransferase
MFYTIIKRFWIALHWFSSLLHVYLTRSLVYDAGNSNSITPGHDYVRIKTVELCRRVLVAEKIEGDIAELGVYKGNFASVMNELFPDRILYLFDSFDGFDVHDFAFDASMKYVQNKQDFSDTSIEQVLKKMPHREKCVVVKGQFPDSALHFDLKFSFVSIDTDLYLPTISGLQYFYPKLENKGYIFVHDYFNDRYKGVRKAVDEFCHTAHAHFTPLPDIAGTVVITKNTVYAGVESNVQEHSSIQR